MNVKHFTGIYFGDFNKNKKQKSHWISIFLLLINLIVIKHVTETLILLLCVEIYNIGISLSYFDQIIGIRESQTWQVFNFAGI